MEKGKSKKNRSLFDRRSGQDRRKAYNIDYFLDGGTERRNSSTGDRRTETDDRRKNWIKISPWSSLHVEENGADPDENEDMLDIE